MLVSSDRYQGSKEVLTLELDVDSPLDEAAREALKHLSRSCQEHAPVSAAESIAVAFDIALVELGGEENICAG